MLVSYGVVVMLGRCRLTLRLPARPDLLFVGLIASIVMMRLVSADAYDCGQMVSLVWSAMFSGLLVVIADSLLLLTRCTDLLAATLTLRLASIPWRVISCEATVVVLGVG